MSPLEDDMDDSDASKHLSKDDVKLGVTRAPSACMPCRRAKRKCDGGHPCSPCTRSRASSVDGCEYAETKDRAANSRAYVQSCVYTLLPLTLQPRSSRPPA